MQGGGICLFGAATATLTNTNVYSNTATDKGPNAFCIHSHCQLTVSYSVDLTWVEGPVTVLPAAPPPAPHRFQPRQCVTTADGVSRCIQIQEGLSLDDEHVQAMIERHFASPPPARPCEGAQVVLSTPSTTSGTCAENNRLDVTQAECQAFNDAEGETMFLRPGSNTAWIPAWTDRPTGCIQWRNGNRFWNQIGSTTDTDENVYLICGCETASGRRRMAESTPKTAD